MWCGKRSNVRVLGLQAAMTVLAALGFRLGYAADTPGATSAPAEEARAELSGGLHAAAQALGDRRPSLKQRLDALAKELQGLEAAPRPAAELATEPTFFFINHIDTFRKLFSRQLSEEEIVRQAGREGAPSAPEAPPSEHR